MRAPPVNGEGEGPRWRRRGRSGVDHVPATSPWSRAGPEPSLDEALDEPIVRLVMRRDRLTAADVRAELTFSAEGSAAEVGVPLPG